MARTLRLQTAHYLSLILIVMVVPFVDPSLLLGSETVQPKPYYRTQLLTGFTKARQTVLISSEVGGKCIAFHAEIGTTIPTSGVLAEIDATYVHLDIQSNRLELESVKRELLTEKKMLQRYTTLLEKNSSTQAKLDEVTLSADLHELKINSLTNQYQRLQENLARHRISAPAGWTMIDRMVEPGEYVQPGGPIAEIGDFTKLIVPLALSFKELQSLKKTIDVPLYFPDLNLRIIGHIYRVSPIFFETTKKIPVDLIVEAKHHDTIIRGGLRAELHLTEQKKDTYVLPLSAVINRYDAYWIVNEDSGRMRVLFLGTTDNGSAAIVSSSELQKEDSILKNIPDDF
ncbi:MAG: membrane fusion protein (multidrug efflux system) [Desulforhopalus sp.]|jgi:membrane fusion protein (multidrug efflux system)